MLSYYSIFLYASKQNKNNCSLLFHTNGDSSFNATVKKNNFNYVFKDFFFPFMKSNLDRISKKGFRLHIFLNCVIKIKYIFKKSLNIYNYV